MPNELILEIFDSIDHPFDAVCLGLATERLWRVGETRIIRLLSHFIAPWSGSRLICVGDNLEAGDYPPSIAQDEILLQRIKSLSTGEREVPSLYDFCAQFSEFSFIHKGLLRERLHSDCSCSRLSAQCIFHEFWIWAESHHRKLGFRWSGDELILRNLSKMVYVRQSGIKPTPLIIALILHIGWSSDPSTRMEYEKEDLHRGPWAGDSFDVCFLSTHQQEVAKGNTRTTHDGVETAWVDVTRQVADHLTEIWECDLGANWKRELTNLWSSI